MTNVVMIGWNIQESIWIYIDLREVYMDIPYVVPKKWKLDSTDEPRSCSYQYSASVERIN